MTCKLFVGHIPTELHKDELRELFQQYGNVTECDIVKNFGFVHYATLEEAKKAQENLDGHEVYNTAIRVELSTSKVRQSAGMGLDTETCYRCGGKGHWSRDCSSGEGGTFRGRRGGGVPSGRPMRGVGLGGVRGRGGRGRFDGAFSEFDDGYYGYDSSRLSQSAGRFEPYGRGGPRHGPMHDPYERPPAQYYNSGPRTYEDWYGTNDYARGGPVDGYVGDSSQMGRGGFSGNNGAYTWEGAREDYGPAGPGAPGTGATDFSRMGRGRSNYISHGTEDGRSAGAPEFLSKIAGNGYNGEAEYDASRKSYANQSFSDDSYNARNGVRSEFDGGRGGAQAFPARGGGNNRVPSMVPPPADQW